MQSEKDSIYASPVGDISPFNFDETVASVFPDMIQRSVPGYNAIISAIGLLARRYAKPHSNCYDLGCSLGAATLSMRQQIPYQSCQLIGIDNSQAMLDRCRQIIAADQHPIPVELQCMDIREVNFVNASVIVLNFTLQFIPLQDRLNFLHNIYQGLLPGGILILSEKLQFADPRQQQLQTDMHHEFKKARGYSDMEISHKRTALENVLLPETLEIHQLRLKTAGFSSTEVWFQYFNFASLIALK